jgi:uncharacterized repeat protein (TIGR01451 family)
MMATNRRTRTYMWGVSFLFGSVFALVLFLALSVQTQAQPASPRQTLPQPTDDDAVLVVEKTVDEDAGWTELNVPITTTVTATITTVTNPSHGDVRIIMPERRDIEYKPDDNYCNNLPGGSLDSFVYTVAFDGSNTQVDVTVTCQNDAPSISAPGAIQAINQDETLTFSTANSNAITISDVDAGGGNVHMTLAVAHGTLAVASTSGLTVGGDNTGNVTIDGSITGINAALNGLVYTPATGYFGNDSLSLSVNDQGNTGAGGSKMDSAAVGIAINPFPPTVRDDSATVAEDGYVNVNVLTNDTSNSGNMDSNSVTVTTNPTHGTAASIAGGLIRYTPVTNYNGPDAFTYRACNTAGLCGTAQVNVTVTAVNDKPTISPINDQTTKEGVITTVAVHVHDIDGDSLTVTASSDNQSLVPDTNLSFTGTGDNRILHITSVDNQVGRATITVIVNDGTASASTTFTLRVTAPDLSISITDGGISVRPGGMVAYTVSYGNGSDPFVGEATGVQISVEVPAHTRFNAGASSSGWSCTQSSPPGTLCRFDIGRLDKGEAGTATFAVTVDAAIPDDVDELEVHAAIADDGTNGSDADWVNNNSTNKTSIDRSVLLVATKRDTLDLSGGNDGIAGEGDRIKYTIVIRNDGLTPTVNALFNDSPDVNSTLEVGSVTTTQGTIVRGNNTGDDDVSIEVGVIDPGDEVTIEFNANINSPLPDGVGSIKNQGFISGDNFATAQTDDPDTPNINDETVTTLGTIPVINANKVDDLLVDVNGDGLASPGDTLVYTVTLANTGAVDATNVVFFDDEIDPHTSLIVGSVTVSDPGATINSGNVAGDTSVQVDMDVLASSETIEIVFTVEIDAALPDDVEQVKNQGFVSSKELAPIVTDDPDTPEKGDATKTAVVTRPLLVALKSDKLFEDVDGDNAFSPGDVLEYLINIRNDGARASAIVLDDVLDPYVSLTRMSPDQDYVQASRGVVLSGNDGSDRRVTVSIDELGAGESVDISFKVKIAGALPEDVLSVQNQGVISAAELDDDVLTDDPDTGLSNDPTVTPITAQIVLDALMSTIMLDQDGSGGYTEGDIILYNIIVENNGNRAAPEAVLEAPLDVHTVLYGDANFVKPDLPINLDTIPASDRALTGFAVQLVNVQDVTEVANQFRICYYDPDEQKNKCIVTDDSDTTELNDPNRTPIQPADAQLYLPIISAQAQ